jgi:hypothetical protein
MLEQRRKSSKSQSHVHEPNDGRHNVKKHKYIDQWRMEWFQQNGCAD